MVGRSLRKTIAIVCGLAWLSLSCALASEAIAQDNAPIPLVSDNSIQRQINQGERHAYHLDLSAGQYVRMTVTAAAFDRLLTQPDADSERAAQRYEVIRQGIMRFFECRGGSSPADLTDETINRVARKLLEGATIQANSIVAYFYGVARNVLREAQRHPDATLLSIEEEWLPRHLADDPAEAAIRLEASRAQEQRLDCLQRCVEQLPPETRRLIFAYYGGEDAAKITNRKRLATALAISMTGLRLRVHRVRKELEACVKACCRPTAE